MLFDPSGSKDDLDVKCQMTYYPPSSNENPNQSRVSVLHQLFYSIKPMIPRRVQLFLRRKIARHKRTKNHHIWPIDQSASQPPQNWIGWPQDRKFAFVLMHDVDTQNGHDKVRHLMDIEEALGFRSSFNFVAERYNISYQLIDEIKSRGFGLGVHGLKHDGKLFASWPLFLQRAGKINRYLSAWDTKGFSSPSMLRNLAWMHKLDIDYGTSTFDTDPFEPQPDGVRSIFPFWVKGNGVHQYLELPYTLPQDFTLFIILGERDNVIWESKLSWIAQMGGMALLNTHPDYMHFGNGNAGLEEYPCYFYKQFLEFVKIEHGNCYWHALPEQVFHFWKHQLDSQKFDNPRSGG